ncbi:DUF7551 domain-containing protein [Halomontanus rarus]|uniref:DUF7551 domain-containing protein n=1 Tax=Halomontanus rarus TaxID=3034020 RepID=UPI001A995273
MVGRTLNDIRRRIDDLADETGSYGVFCGRSGEQFVPITGRRFRDRESATEAAIFAAQYRSTLREYDPQFPYYDPIVCEGPAHARVPERDPDSRSSATTSSPIPTGGARRSADERNTHRTETDRRPPDDSRLIEYCHDVAATVFEQLSEQGHDRVETALMNAYLERVETVADRDRFCVELLRTMAFELDDRLSAAEQARVLDAAAQRLPSTNEDTRDDRDPLEATLSALRSQSVIDSFTVDRHPPDGETGRQSWTVTLGGYAFGTGSSRVPTLPIAIDLLSRSPDSVTVSAASSVGTCEWRLELVFAAENPPRGLTTVSTVRE